MKFRSAPGVEATHIIRAIAVMLLHTGVRLSYDWRGTGATKEVEYQWYFLQDALVEQLTRLGYFEMPNFFYVVDVGPPRIVLSHMAALPMPPRVSAYRIDVMRTLINGVFTFNM